MLTLIAGVVAMTVAFMGFCTGKARDRCSVCFFSITTFIMFLVYFNMATGFMILHLKSDQLMDFYCKGEERDLGPIELFLLEESKESVSQINSFLKEDVEKYMCTAECPCS